MASENINIQIIYYLLIVSANVTFSAIAYSVFRDYIENIKQNRSKFTTLK